MQVPQNNILQFVSSGVDKIRIDDIWISQKELSDIIQQVSKCLESDYKLAMDKLEYIFSARFDAEFLTRETYKLISDWHNGENLFHITSMIFVALEQFGFSSDLEGKIEDNPLARAMLVAGILAEVPHDLPYHNNLHFQKVLLHVMRMVAVHNNLYKDTAHCLDKNDIAKLIIAACIHDIGHDGKSNIVDHKYHLAMIEQRSFSYAYPFLESVGLDGAFLSDIKIMLMTTDISPIGDPISPVKQLRRAYEYHFGMGEEEAENEEGDESELSEELSVLLENSHLCLLSVMLQEADIMNSAGVSYDITCYESIAVSKEIGRSRALPEDTLLFLNTICNGRMLSDAARFLADDNLEKIIGQVLEDYRNGNKPYD